MATTGIQSLSPYGPVTTIKSVAIICLEWDFEACSIIFLVVVATHDSIQYQPISPLQQEYLNTHASGFGGGQQGIQHCISDRFLYEL